VRSANNERNNSEPGRMRADASSANTLWMASCSVVTACFLSQQAMDCAIKTSRELQAEADRYHASFERRHQRFKEINQQIARLEYECSWAYAWHWLYETFWR
jgi:septal ring factor EnvC (AmiA/AmiB activator)